MIRYSLKCASDHAFESWFADAAAFAALQTAGHLACPVCGDHAIEKALMAPAVRPARKAAASEPAAPPAPQGAALSQPGSALEAALTELRRQVEKNSEYVGEDFATEARRIHDGERPERAIHGEARAEDARRLLEDGIPVLPLPFLPGRKTN